MKTDTNLAMAINRAKKLMQQTAVEVHPARWQGMDVSKKPEMVSYEILNFNFTAPLERIDLEYYQRQCEPNLPWADDHFKERVSGVPLNPGTEWRNWPWSRSADRFRTNEAFNHSYMERFWPRFAGHKAATTVEEWNKWADAQPILEAHKGLRHEYGDLNDLVRLLAHDPLTRQAWIPLFFPEDTGIADGGRKPCTLGYQVILRNNRLSMYYPLRSCDFVRHFRDDIYLAVRLLLWIINRCAELNPEAWYNVKPGTLTFHATSLHCFKPDWPLK